VPPELLARGWLALGDRDRALDWIERGIEAQSSLASIDATNWWFDALHGDPRFERVVAHATLR
jgi:hypothetical protein